MSRALGVCPLCVTMLLAAILFISPGPAVSSANDAYPMHGGAEEAATLTLTLEEATLMSLERNRALAVERFNQDIARTDEEREEGAFDPVYSGELATGRTENGDGDSAGTTNATLNAAKRFAVGAEAEATLSATANEAPLEDEVRLGVKLTQSLLRGFGRKANLAAIRRARLATEVSGYELRGFILDLVASLQSAYWDYYLTRRQIEIVTESYDLAKRQLDETNERIRVGVLAEVERVAAEAELALRREALINARADHERARIALVRLLNPPLAEPFGARVEIAAPPMEPPEGGAAGNVEEHAALAMLMRPELNQAKLELLRGELEVVTTRNGALPKLDLFISLGKSGYADSFSKAFGNIGEEGYDAQVGLTGELPWPNRARGADAERAGLTLLQSRAALENLAELAEVDVRTAHIEVERQRAQMEATEATRKLREENLRTETGKFRVGRSTNLLVARAQRDLLESQIAEIAAGVNFNKALIELYRQDGSLLMRNGIKAPGEEPADLSSPR